MFPCFVSASRLGYPKLRCLPKCTRQQTLFFEARLFIVRIAVIVLRTGAVCGEQEARIETQR
jgi:hypothetical protein